MKRSEIIAISIDPDMFGVTPKVRVKYPKNGYASTPGSGPPGEFCKTCLHCAKVDGGQRYFHKCLLIEKRWTNSYGTDVLLKSPACRRWEKQSDKN